MASKSASFLEAVKARRSIYKINDKSPISDDAIVNIVEQAVLHVPSSFNTQASRLVVLLKDEHRAFWKDVSEVLKTMVPEEQWSHTQQRMDGFGGGYGTILFFEDPDPVNAMASKFAQYADKFPQWSEHSSAMHQYVLWTALELEGFGCSLQHYNPIADQKVQNHWNIPLKWSLKAQLVFGGKAGEPMDKTFEPLEKRLFVHGK